MRTKLTALLLTAAAVAAAQSSNGYAFFAPGGAATGLDSRATYEAGFGVEGILGKGIGLAAELNCRSYHACYGGSTLALFSLGGSYHFIQDKQQKFDPFVAGGWSADLSAAVFGEAASLLYCSGGANYWLSRRLGFRCEFRDDTGRLRFGTHYWGFRMGVAIR